MLLCEPPAATSTSDARQLAAQYLPFAAALARRRAAALGLDADDLLGELQLLLVRNARYFDPDRGTWFRFVSLQLRGAVARLRRQHRRYSREVAATTDDGEPLVEFLPGLDEAPDLMAADSAAIKAALEAVDGLPPRWRFVVRRHLGLGGVEPEQFERIGNALGVSGARAAKLFEQAMWRIRRRLGDG